MRKGFFNLLLSVSDTGTVDISHVVDACMELKGSATSVDLQCVSYEVRLIRRSLSTSISIQWPEEEEGDGDEDDRWERLEQLIQKTMKKLAKGGGKKKGGGSSSGMGSSDPPIQYDVGPDRAEAHCRRVP